MLHLVELSFVSMVPSRSGLVQEQARDLSNTTYELGSLLLELSLATTNLGQAANGNAGPLLCAQTGFLAPDGSHANVTNRSPAVNPYMGLAGRMPVNVQNAQGAVSVLALPWHQRRPSK